MAITNEARGRGGATMAAGALAVLLGVLALTQPAAASAWADLVVGGCLAAAGLARLWAAARGTAARRLVSALVGAAWLALGLFLAIHLLIGTALLTVALALGLAAAGAAQLWGALRGGTGWPGLAAGAVSLGLAVAILLGLPGSIFETLGIVLGIELIAGGLAAIAMVLLARGPA